SSSSLLSLLPPPRRSTLFPYTTLFRSRPRRGVHVDGPPSAAGLGRRGDQARFVRTRRADGPALRCGGHSLRRRGQAFRRYGQALDRKSTRLNSSHLVISYAVFCLKKKK